MSAKTFNVLFLCTGNSARSILAERLVEAVGHGKFRGFSAGSHPKGAVHPMALAVLRHAGLSTDGLRSKGWEEFAATDAPVMDFVFTVCDDAAGEVCPVWPGQPMTAHWGIPDPASVQGSEIEQMNAFRDAYHRMKNRIELFASLPIATLDKMTLQHKLMEIGKSDSLQGAHG
jgi:arsenate reductase